MKAKTVILFNHKGGVSKTLTTFNLAWSLTEKEKKVLLVDCDSQCNLSALLLRDAFDDYYTNPTTKIMNVKDGLRVAFESRPEPIKAIDCFVSPLNESLFLIPGHMDLSEFEPSLSLSMNSNNSMTALQNLPGSLYKLIELCADRYNVDYVLIDINPGLSALNQIVFTASDGFIVPTNPDPFSLMALKTLLKVLPRWKSWADNTRPHLEAASYPLPTTDMKFIGEISQRFSRRKGKPTASFEATIQEITYFVEHDFASKLRSSDMVYERAVYHLQEIPDFGALLQKANEFGVPVFKLENDQLPTGAAFENTITKRDEIKGIFSDIADIVLETL
jgi:cellulose biosynthesis protein BcsQ